MRADRGNRLDSPVVKNPWVQAATVAAKEACVMGGLHPPNWPREGLQDGGNAHFVQTVREGARHVTDQLRHGHPHLLRTASFSLTGLRVGTDGTCKATVTSLFPTDLSLKRLIVE